MAQPPRNIRVGNGSTVVDNVTPWSLVTQAIKAVPAVRYALGVGGVAAIVAIIAGFKIDYRVAVFGTIIVFGLMFVLVLFARFTSFAGAALYWPIMVATWSFMLMIIATTLLLISSFFFEWPKPLNSYVQAAEIRTPGSDPNNHPPSAWSTDNCKTMANDALNAFAFDRTNTLRVEDLIQCKNPVGYSLRGSEKYYRGAYEEAEKDFELALKRLPSNAALPTMVQWKNNLASAQIETGKFAEAIDGYQEILKLVQSDGYRWDLSKAHLYQGQNDSRSYEKAIELLIGVNKSFAGKVAQGRVEILLAAAYAGNSTRSDISDADKRQAQNNGRTNLCSGIARSSDFWRAVLNGTTQYPNASFKEERRLLQLLGGGAVSCATASN